MSDSVMLKVSALLGRSPANMLAQAEEWEARAAKSLPPGRVFKYGAMSVSVPFEATYEDVIQIATDLLEFAKNQLQASTEAAHH